MFLVNEPPSDDPIFSKAKPSPTMDAGFTSSKSCPKGAIGALLIHKAEMASYPWEVVRNSNCEKSYLKLDARPN